MIVALVLIALTWADLGYAEEDRGSAGYLLALCKTYLDLVENEAETLQNLGRTEPARFDSGRSVRRLRCWRPRNVAVGQSLPASRKT